MENKLCIIVPYRDRVRHINKFLPHYQRLLPDAYFCVVEQSIHGEFNRGKIKNIGFLECPDFDYYAFHDVDMLVQGVPDYSYPDKPTLCATNASQFNWQMPFPEYFGGVVLFNKQDFITCNGYSNNFSGWGGEDNELYYRVAACNLEIAHRSHRYLSLPHPRSHPTGFDLEKMKQAKKPRKKNDGLSNCKYTIAVTTQLQNGKKILVDI